MADTTLSMSEIGNLLKVSYGGVLPNQVNTKAGPWQKKLDRNTDFIVGGEKIEKLAPYGINGGVGAFNETGSLPGTSKQQTAKFTAYVKNQAGRALFTEKALKMSVNNKVAFISAMASAMDSLRENCTLDYSRQCYLDGTGKLTLCATTSNSTTLNVVSTQYLVEGLVIDIRNSSNALITSGGQRKILGVLSDTSVLIDTAVTAGATDYVTVQGAYGLELTGIDTVMAQSGSLYGLARADYPFLNAKKWDLSNTSSIDDTAIVKAILERETKVGAMIDLLVAHPDVYVSLGDYFTAAKQSVNTLTLEGGWTALSVNGKPVTYDRFAKKNSLRGFDMSNWHEHMLHDWEFFTGANGETLMHMPGTTNFEVISTKYSDIMCDKPGANFTIENIAV